MQIIKLKKENITEVMTILNENYNEVMKKFHSQAVLDRFKKHNTYENWENQMKWKEIFVVQDNEIIIATGSLANFGDDTSSKYCISNFFVGSKFQNKGVGKFLFKHILEISKNKGINLLHVPSSRTGFEFYKKVGFIKDDIQDDEIDEIIWMTLKISDYISI
ncbi:GNAT family N-acetyltransferase [Clostridium sp. SHJSY1]|uniref:GNAT family N-acetyltransferase n=1 Tax=Clostridium sp. SHJSY1 TaxID=2942483 RepID=UPI00287412FC|nr:GNAT family N-acetyltransferase [Clostridium sp. SHJSY1]MDS0528052.1 GNAT family N-acetyltransferase [Clostridium sp. SHJSY1]